MLTPKKKNELKTIFERIKLKKEARKLEHEDTKKIIVKENVENEDKEVCIMKKENSGKVKSTVDIFEKKIKERKLEDKGDENLVKIKETEKMKIKLSSKSDIGSPSISKKRTLSSPITSKKIISKNSRKLEGKLKTAKKLNPIGEPICYDGRFVAQKSIKDFWERKLDDNK